MKANCSLCGKSISWDSGSITSGSPEAALWIFGHLCNDCARERHDQQRHEELIDTLRSTGNSSSAGSGSYSVSSDPGPMWLLSLNLCWFLIGPGVSVKLWLLLHGSPAELLKWGDSGLLWFPFFNVIGLVMFIISTGGFGVLCIAGGVPVTYCILGSMLTRQKKG